MQIIRKIVATGLAALMAGASLAMPVLAATNLSNYPTFLAKDNALDAFVVVGASAATSDVVGAVDLAVRLAELSSVTKTVTAVAAAVDGTEKDTVGLSDLLSVPFPASGVLKTAHFSGLKDSTISWKSTDYDYREQVDFSGVQMRHELDLSNVNGTEKMVVESGDVKYQFVFEKALNLSSATTAGTTGTTTTPEYSSPVNIKMLGKDFSIVGVSSNQVKVLQGTIGTATATSGVTYGDYTAYSDQGSNNAWARIIIKDKDGNTKDTLIIDDPDATSAVTSKDSSATGLTVKVTAVRALQDGTVIGTDVVVGPTGTVEKTYDNTADVTSTGTTSDRFSTETDWGIQVGARVSPGTGTSFTGCPGSCVVAGDVLEVIYKPTSTKYLVAGEKISLPNNYGELKFVGWNTDKFATITIEPLGGTTSAYNNSLDTQSFGNLNGLKISTDVGGSIVSQQANNGFDSAYILWNYTTAANNANPVMVGFYDKAKGKIMVNGTFDAVSGGPASPTAGTTSQEYVSKYLNRSAAISDENVTYTFTLNYGNAGDNSFYMKVVLGGSAGILVNSMGVGNTTAANSIMIGYQNKTDPSTTSAPEFRLGDTASSAESREINTTTEGGTRDNAGNKAQEIVDDSGILLQNTASYGASDKVVFKVPFKNLRAKVYFGKPGTAAGATTYKEIVPVTSSVAKLDSEVGTAEKAKNLVLVGGPCVNTLVAELATASGNATAKFPYTCANWPAENFALIKAVDNGFTTGKVALVVAGTRAADTRLATSVLQNYDQSPVKTKLTGSSVKVSGTSVATATITAA